MSVVIHHNGYRAEDLYTWLSSTGKAYGAAGPGRLEVGSVDAVLTEIARENGWYVEAAPARLLAMLPAGQLWGPLAALNYRTGLTGRLEQVTTFEFGHCVQVDLVDDAGDVVVSEVSSYWPAPSAQATSVGPSCRLLVIEWLDTAGNVCATKYRFKPYVTLAAPISKQAGETWSTYAARFAAAAAVPGALAAAGPSIAAGRRRRQNVIDELSAVIGGVLLAADPNTDPSIGGTAFLSSLAGADSAFLHSGSTALATAVTASSPSTFPWLAVELAPGLTVQVYLLSKLAPWTAA
jgi:hypothetical protein